MEEVLAVSRSARNRRNAWMAKFLDPFMIHESFPTLTENAFGSHPRCVVSVTYCNFHVGNTGSNPVGDAKHGNEVI